MARNTIVLISLAVFVLGCLLQSTSASFDLMEFLQGKILQTIEKENITCSNYREFCEKSNNQIQASANQVDQNVNEMAINMCETILEIYVCNNEIHRR